MAKKLYLFGIGGTGSRVIKSFAMLLASGCVLENNFETVIPVIIDTDINNGDLKLTKDVLRLYQTIRSQIDHPNDFFKQNIKTINELSEKDAQIKPEYYQFKLDGVDQDTFGDYIGFDRLSENATKSFVKLLFSEQNIKSSLDVGFKGNPNMGSIVLNQFTRSKIFEKFAQTFNDGDAIFIVNSIFGGTGAAGFPLLLKNLRGNTNLPNYAKIKDSAIGGITYLPYFSLDEQAEIKSETFDDKAKSAIEYYNRTIIDFNRINTLYFIGNDEEKKYLKYAVGKSEQKNEANFLEMAGALAIFDFCKTLHFGDTQIKEFGIEKLDSNVTFKHLDMSDAKKISLPLTKYKLFSNYLNNEKCQNNIGITRWTKSKIKFVKEYNKSVLNKNYFESAEYENQIKKFNDIFEQWIEEMSNNKPAFVPFNQTGFDNALSLVNGTEAKGNISFKNLDVQNCRSIDKYNKSKKRHTALVKLFGETTDIIVKKQILGG